MIEADKELVTADALARGNAVVTIKVECYDQPTALGRVECSRDLLDVMGGPRAVAQAIVKELPLWWLRQRRFAPLLEEARRIVMAHPARAGSVLLARAIRIAEGG